ncbi:Conserved_hypothetical protein [Hexamita inflata]|uniref:Uncharacterized protein n=1 Tax=Hexamita inflata TaxID=28002 RepID=A0AA86NJY9_9EUKA|nr:Conserved hypothetical protein [Hexamita inflata]
MEKIAYSLYTDDVLFYETLMLVIENLENNASDLQEINQVLDVLAKQDYSGCLYNYQNAVLAVEEGLNNNSIVTIHNQDTTLNCKGFITQSVDNVDDTQSGEIFLSNEIQDQLNIPTRKLNALFGYQIVEQEGENLKKYVQMAKASEVLDRLPHHITPVRSDLDSMQQSCTNKYIEQKIKTLQKDEVRALCEQTIKYANDLNLTQTSTILCTAGILYKAVVTEANEFESIFLELMNKDDKESQKVEVENQLVPNFHQVVMLNSAGKHYKTAARLFNCSHYIINSGGNNRGDSCSYCMRSGHVVPHFRGQ